MCLNTCSSPTIVSTLPGFRRTQNDLFRSWKRLFTSCQVPLCSWLTRKEKLRCSIHLLVIQLHDYVFGTVVPWKKMLIISAYPEPEDGDGTMYWRLVASCSTAVWVPWNPRLRDVGMWRAIPKSPSWIESAIRSGNRWTETNYLVDNTFRLSMIIIRIADKDCTASEHAATERAGNHTIVRLQGKIS